MKTILERLFSSILVRLFAYLKKINQRNTYEEYRFKCKIHSSFLFNGNETIFYGDGEIDIDQNTFIGRNLIIQNGIGYKVTIGKNY